MQPDKIVDIGTGPVKGMKRYHSRLFICCGIEVVVMEVTKDMVVTRRWKALDKYATSFFLVQHKLNNFCSSCVTMNFHPCPYNYNYSNPGVGIGDPLVY